MSAFHLWWLSTGSTDMPIILALRFAKKAQDVADQLPMFGAHNVSALAEQPVDRDDDDASQSGGAQTAAPQPTAAQPKAASPFAQPTLPAPAALPDDDLPF